MCQHKRVTIGNKFANHEVVSYGAKPTTTGFVQRREALALGGTHTRVCLGNDMHQKHSTDGGYMARTSLVANRLCKEDQYMRDGVLIEGDGVFCTVAVSWGGMVQEQGLDDFPRGDHGSVELAVTEAPFPWQGLRAAEHQSTYGAQGYTGLLWESLQGFQQLIALECRQMWKRTGIVQSLHHGSLVLDVGKTMSKAVETIADV